jgi:7-cyano-7-deazaguanine reductase
MAEAEGLRLPFESPDAVTFKVLETFPYSGPDQRVTYETQEFSAVCPFSGLPDFGLLRIEYTPRARCVELKSLKYYLLSYRNVGIYQEHAAAKLFDDLKKLLDPKALTLTLIYKTRGGIDTSCVVSTQGQV